MIRGRCYVLVTALLRRRSRPLQRADRRLTLAGMSASAPQLARGTRVAGFRIERPLGRGGMSMVYVAEDLRLHRKVALKVIAPELASDAAFRERFLTESELAASLDHPHVIPIFAAVVGVIVLNEEILWYQPVGAAIVLLGVAISQRTMARSGVVTG